MDLTLVPRQRDGHTGRVQESRVLLALVDERVVLGGLDERGRGTAEVGRSRGRGVRMVTAGAVEVLPPVPLHLCTREIEPNAVRPVAGRVEIVVDHRVDEDLQHELKAALARAKRNDRGKVPARAVAGDGDARRVGAELGGALNHPFGRGAGVVDGGGERVLGRESVVDRDDNTWRPRRECAAHGIMWTCATSSAGPKTSAVSASTARRASSSESSQTGGAAPIRST